jgi:hypothetical protein
MKIQQHVTFCHLVGGAYHRDFAVQATMAQTCLSSHFGAEIWRPQRAGVAQSLCFSTFIAYIMLAQE